MLDDEGYCTYCSCKPCECEVTDAMEDQGIIVTSAKPETMCGYSGKSATDILKENHKKLIKAATELRQVQREYMADRGNDAKGKVVAHKAEELDKVLKLCK